MNWETVTNDAGYIPRPRPPRLDGSDRFIVGGAPLDGTEVALFWKWAFSSLTDNTLRGDLMEWAVGHLLGLEFAERGDWTPFDLTEGTTTIQVKQSSYLQGWAQRKPSTPRFSGLIVSAWDPETDSMSPKALHCDWYILALLACTDAARWNPLDLDQWIFYLVPRATLAEGPYASVGLAALDGFTRDGKAHRLSASELRERGRSLMNLDRHDPVTLVEAHNGIPGTVQ